MDLLKQQLARLQQQLSGLTASQKMLSVALVAIMAMTLFWWSRYAGEAQYEPLLNQSFTADDISQITSHLESKGISYTITGDRIMIPADKKIEVLADLGFAHLLPQKTNAGFDEIVKQMTPWDPADKTARLWVEAKQRTLEAVLDNFPGVREADVVIDPSDERRFDGHDIYSTAMVSLSTSSGQDSNVNTKQLAMTAADLVAGAVAGLSRGRVTVVVDGATIPVPDKSADDGLPNGDDFVDATRQAEEMFRNQIKEQLGFITGLFVSVRVDLNTKKVETEQTTVDAKASAHLSVTEEEKENDTTMPPNSGTEPGAGGNLSANGSLAVGQPAATGGTSTETETKTQYDNIPSETKSRTVQGPGDATPVSASVRVPRTYFIGMYKALNKGADPPDDNTLTQLIKDELDRIRQDVKNCTGIKADDAVAVNWYADDAGQFAPGPISRASQPLSSPMAMLLLAHTKDIGVSVLAAFCMFMVMMMVRKSAPVAIPSLEMNQSEQEPPQHIGGDTQLVGEVAEGANLLDGKELAEEEVQAQQMVDQVSNMVSENPEAAANLVKRWLNRS